MKRWIAILILTALLVGCSPQSVSSVETSPLPAASTSTPPGKMETKIAATLHANETSTAVAKLSPFYAAGTADAMTAAVRTPIPTAAVFKINVPASACWMNSKVSVLTGQRVMISASGTVNTYGGREGSNNDPNGQKGVCGAIQCPLQGVGYGALIGRIDDGKTFFVATSLEFVSTKDGQLYFTVNDWECQDNSGAFDLVVTIP